MNIESDKKAIVFILFELTTNTLMASFLNVPPLSKLLLANISCSEQVLGDVGLSELMQGTLSSYEPPSSSSKKSCPQVLLMAVNGGSAAVIQIHMFTHVNASFTAEFIRMG